MKKHEFTDFVYKEEFKEALKDPRYEPYAAGFAKAKEIFNLPNPSQLAFVTSSLDYFIRWREEKDNAGGERVDL